MNKTALFVLVLTLIGALVLGYGWSTFNGLVVQSEAITGQWSQVENQYQRRFDLIPNLVNALKGSLKQEQIVFGDIAKARTEYGGAKTVDDKAKAAGQVESSLSRLLLVMENYPELKSLRNVNELMVELEGTENRLGVERMRYNDLVRRYNTKIKSVPTIFFAARLGFNEKAYFESVSGAEVAPNVSI